MHVLIKGPSGEKIGRWDEVEAKPVEPEMAARTTIRVLISDLDGAPTFIMRLFEIEPGGYIRAHKHPWEHEIFVLSGTGEIRIGNSVYRVSEGYFIYIPPNVEHEYWNRSNTVFRFLCLIPMRPSVEAR